MSTRFVRRALSGLVVTLVLIDAMVSAALAAPFPYSFTFDGSQNTAVGPSGLVVSGTVDIDVSLLTTPGTNDVNTAPGALTNLIFTVTGSTMDDGVYAPPDGTWGWVLDDPIGLDFSTELVGQPTNIVNTFGDASGASNFNFFSLVPLTSGIGGFSNDIIGDIPAGILAQITTIRPAAVPEPTSLALWMLLGTGLMGYGWMRYRKRRLKV